MFLPRSERNSTRDMYLKICWVILGFLIFVAAKRYFEGRIRISVPTSHIHSLLFPDLDDILYKHLHANAVDRSFVRLFVCYVKPRRRPHVSHGSEFNYANQNIVKPRDIFRINNPFVKCTYFVSQPTTCQPDPNMNTAVHLLGMTNLTPVWHMPHISPHCHLKKRPQKGRLASPPTCTVTSITTWPTQPHNTYLRMAILR